MTGPTNLARSATWCVRIERVDALCGAKKRPRSIASTMSTKKVQCGIAMPVGRGPTIHRNVERIHLAGQLNFRPHSKAAGAQCSRLSSPVPDASRPARSPRFVVKVQLRLAGLVHQKRGPMQRVALHKQQGDPSALKTSKVGRLPPIRDNCQLIKAPHRTGDARWPARGQELHSERSTPSKSRIRTIFWRAIQQRPFARIHRQKSFPSPCIF